MCMCKAAGDFVIDKYLVFYSAYELQRNINRLKYMAAFIGSE